MNSELAYELQCKLVSCCIDFLKEHRKSNIDKVDFTIDNIQESIAFGSWHSNSDSCCTLYNDKGLEMSKSL